MASKYSLSIASLLLLVGVGSTGCSVTVTNTDSCALDPSMDCGTSGTGYSCTGSALPPASAGSCLGDDVGEFCCYPSLSCAQDSSVVCGAGADGFSCAAGDTPPDQQFSNLICSEPSPDGALDLYCCYDDTTPPPASATCVEDGTVNCPDPYSYGFSCTGSDAPDVDFSNLTCSDSTAGTDAHGNAANLFCCNFN